MNRNKYDIALKRIKEAKEENRTILDLSSLELFEVPEEIGDCISLIDLDLSNNNLKRLPESIYNLKRLMNLNISDNDFSDLEGLNFDIGCNLFIKNLDISSNNFSKVPKDIYNLSFLDEISIDDNPLLENVPSEILEQGIEAIFNYTESLVESKNTTRLYECKLILLGQGEVGKTTLMKKLINENEKIIEGREKTTHGINIKDWKIPIEFTAREAGLSYSEVFEIKKSLGDINYYDFEYDLEVSWDSIYVNEDLKINIWDFGGQEIYHTTHQFFLTKRSLYLFVWDPRKEEQYQSFEYWFNIICLLSDNGCISRFRYATFFLIILSMIISHLLLI